MKTFDACALQNWLACCCCLFKMDSDVLQRCLRRLDHIEYTVANRLSDDSERMRDDLSQLKSTVGRIQKARKAHEDESAPALPMGSHRGPGALPMPAGPPQVVPLAAQAMAQSPTPAPVQSLASDLSIARGNLLEQAVHMSRSAHSSPGPRGAFTNTLVRTKPASTERFTIGSPASASDDNSRVPVPMPALPHPAPAKEDETFQSPVATTRPCDASPLPTAGSNQQAERLNAHGDSCHARAEGEAPAPQSRARVKSHLSPSGPGTVRSNE